MIPEFNPNQVNINQQIHVGQEQKENICIICTGNINSQPESEGMKGVASKCNHLFHSDCINKNEVPMLEPSFNEVLQRMAMQEDPSLEQRIAKLELNYSLYLINALPNMQNPGFRRVRESDERVVVGGFNSNGFGSERHLT